MAVTVMEGTSGPSQAPMVDDIESTIVGVMHKPIALLLATLATSCNNIGKGLQKSGTAQLPPLQLNAKTLKMYVNDRNFAVGVLLDILGAAFGAVSLGMAPVSVVQPIFCAGVAVLAVFSHFFLSERMSRREILAVLLSLAGAIMVAATMQVGSDQVLPMPAVGVVATVLVLLAILELIARKQLSKPQAEVIAGLQSGLCIGVANAAIRLGTLLAMTVSRLFIPVGMGSGIALAAGGMFFQNRGFGIGRAVVIVSYANITSLVTAIAAGVIALNESFPIDWQSILLRLMGMATLIQGSSMLMDRGGATSKRSSRDFQGKGIV